MKRLFLAILLILTAATVYTVKSARERASDVPQLPGRSDANPQREDQIDLFKKWLVKNGHTTVKGEPAANVILESANNQSTMIQAVSGMAGDIFDTSDVMGYQQLGVGVDITDDANKNGYGFADTYPGMRTLLSGVDGRQYGYPCNGGSLSFWINLTTLKELGMERPPREWTPEEFEVFAKEFVKRANAGLPRQERFITDSMDGGSGVHIVQSIARSRGADIYNETQTRSIADNQIFRDGLTLIHKWTFVDRITPTAADVASMAVEAGYGGTSFANLMNGKYAMALTGRYCLIRAREDALKAGKTIEYGVSQMPMYEFKVLPITARAAMVYEGSQYKDFAKLFAQFLSGKEYNDYIVAHADGLPPNPAIARDGIFALRKQYPNENDTHELEFTWAGTIGMPTPLSPYVKAGTTNWLQYNINRFFNNRCSLEEAVADIERRYNAEIETAKKANPSVREHWEKAWANQEKIDQLKAAGKKIPANLITNPYWQSYYRQKGMLEESTPEAKR